jgi:hypothetical protein
LVLVIVQMNLLKTYFWRNLIWSSHALYPFTATAFFYFILWNFSFQINIITKFFLKSFEIHSRCNLIWSLWTIPNLITLTEFPFQLDKPLKILLKNMKNWHGEIFDFFCKKSWFCNALWNKPLMDEFKSFLFFGRIIWKIDSLK